MYLSLRLVPSGSRIYKRHVGNIQEVGLQVSRKFAHFLFVIGIRQTNLLPYLRYDLDL